MKQLNTYIKEALDDNVLWKLDKWFESHESEQKEFMNLVFTYQDKREKKVLEDALNEKNTFSNVLKEIINFTNDNIKPENEIDYVNELKILITYLLDNKTSKNKYVKK